MTKRDTSGTIYGATLSGSRALFAKGEGLKPLSHTKPRHLTVVKGEKIEQTVENLQSIMEIDAMILQAHVDEIAKLRQKVNNLQQKLKKARKS